MRMKCKLAYIWASWFGTGFFPFASGTVGSLFTLPLAYFCLYWGGLSILLATIAIVFFTGRLASKIILTENPTLSDPSFIVIDEVLGQLVTFIPLASFFHTNLPQMNYSIFLLGFILFRFFDITKIWPASFFDKQERSAFGIMMDDMIAGLYASIILTCYVYFML